MATVVLVGTLDTKGREYAFLADRIRERAPVSTDPYNKTPGSLRASVKRAKSNSRKRPEAVVLVDDVAAVPNEFGTSKMKAQPFARVDINHIIE